MKQRSWKSIVKPQSGEGRFTAMKNGEQGPRQDDGAAWNPSLRKALFIVAVLFVAALAVRLAFWSEFSASDWHVLLEKSDLDSFKYHAWAERIAVEGDLLLKDEGLFTLSPFYSYCLAAIYFLLGAEIFTAILVQLLLGAASVILMYLAGSLVFNRLTGIAAAAITAFYGQFVLIEGVLLSEAFLPFMTALFICWTAWSLKRGKPPLFIVSGLLLGALFLIRPQYFPVFLLLPAAALLGRDREKRKENIKIIACGVIGAALAAAPIAIRNVVVSGKPVVLTTTGGVNFYIGNYSGATGTWTIPKGFRTGQSAMFEDFATAAGAKEYDETVSRYWAAEALDDMADDPGAWIQLMVKKAALFWNNYEIPVNFDYGFLKKNLVSPHFAFIPFAAVAVLGLLGAYLALRRRRDAARGTGWLLLIGGGYFLGTILFFISARYRVAVVPYTILFAAFVVERSAAFIREHGWGKVVPQAASWGGAVAAGALVVSLFCYTGMEKRVPPHLTMGRYQFMGLHFWENDDPERGERWIRKTSEMDRSNPIMRVYLAGVLHDMGRAAESDQESAEAERLLAERVSFLMGRGGVQQAAMTARMVLERWFEVAGRLDKRGHPDRAEEIRAMAGRIERLLQP